MKRSHKFISVIILLTLLLTACGRNNSNVKDASQLGNADPSKNQSESVQKSKSNKQQGSDGGIKAEGKIVEKEYDLDKFENIKVDSQVDIEYTVGEEISVKAKMHENFLENMSIFVEDNQLVIDNKTSFSYEDLEPEEYPKIHITAPSVNKLELMGTTNFVSTTPIISNFFNLKTYGGVNCKLVLDTDEAQLDINGGTDVKISGRANKVECAIKEAGDLDTFDLLVNNMDLNLSGASSAKVNVSDTLDIDVTGTGEVFYKGTAKVTQNVSGTADVIKVE